MEKKEQELLTEITKVVALGLGVLAWHLLSGKDAEYRSQVMKQIQDAILYAKL